MTLLDPIFWVDKIIASCPLFNSQVFETLENDAAVLDFYLMPLALVYVLSDSSESSELINRMSQKHDAIIVVKIAIRKTVSKIDRLNADDSRLIRACRMELLTSIVGWMPEDCEAPIEHVSGELSIKDNLIFWTDKFTTFNYLRL